MTKTKTMSKKTIIAACGDICTACPRYKATIAHDKRKLEEIAELWHRLGFRDKIQEADEMKCVGCNNDKPCAHGINKCPQIAMLDNCGQCTDYPCGKINSVFERTSLINSKCKNLCSPLEYEELKSAFLLKKEVLDGIHDNYRTT